MDIDMLPTNNRYSILTMSNDDNNDTLNNQKDKSNPCKVQRGFNKKQHVKKQNLVGLKMFSTNGAGIVGGK